MSDDLLLIKELVKKDIEKLGAMKQDPNFSDDLKRINFYLQRKISELIEIKREIEKCKN